jgi:bifunctional non-homologous end joining protein LigD
MRISRSSARREASELPRWIRPQPTELVDAAPDGDQWLHEIKYDGYRMHARLDRGAVRLLTRTGLNWTHKYPAIAAAFSALGNRRRAYLDGELCGVGPDGITSFSMIQLASDAANAAGLVFFLFDLLHLDGDDVAARPLVDRKNRLAELLSEPRPPLQFSDHQVGHGPTFFEKACAMSLEGIVSKRADAAYAPGARGLWLKVKCLHREESVVVGWTDREGTRPYLGALLLAYYDPDGRLVYAGRVGSGINTAELGQLWRRLQPLAVSKMPLEVAPPRSTRFGSPLVLSERRRLFGRGAAPQLACWRNVTVTCLLRDGLVAVTSFLVTMHQCTVRCFYPGFQAPADHGVETQRLPLHGLLDYRPFAR